MSAYWALSELQRWLLRSIIEGRKVIDVGAGDLSLSQLMVGMGAREVLAIEKEAACFRRWPESLPNIVVYRGYVAQVPAVLTAGADVIVTSWPINYEMPGLVLLMKQVPTVVYLGVNDNVTVCGSPGFWEHVRTREVINAEYAEQAVLVYGKKTPEHQERELEPGEPSPWWRNKIKNLRCSGF